MPIDGFLKKVILRIVNTTEQSESVRFTTKGQVVIPLRLRKQFHIEDGTRAIVSVTNEGILLKPVTAVLIKRGRGIIKRKPGAPSISRWWAEHKAEEKAMEEAAYARHSA